MNMLFSIISTIAATHGMGKHQNQLTIESTIQTLKYVTIAQTVGIILAGAVKIVLGIFLLRIVIQRWHRIALLIPMAIVTILCIITVTCLWLQKTPVESIYNPTIQGTVHLNQTTLSLVYSCKICLVLRVVGKRNLILMMFNLLAILIVSDFFYALFPWIFMWKIQMGKKEKTLILCGLSLGIM
jgi:hypothetical protein